MNDNGNTQEEKEEGKAATSSQICTSEAGECGKKVKNAEKKARKFSFDEIFKETYANARLRASAKEVARENVSDNPKGSCVAEELGAMSVQSKRSVERNVHHESELEVHSEVTSKIAVDDAVDDFAVPLPPGFTVDKNTQSPEETSQLQLERKNDGDEGDEFDDFGEGIPVVHLIPAACEAILKHGKKPVSALAFDQQGTGFTTGGYDYIVNLFDFQQMDVSLRPSRELIPCESHVINCLSWSSNGERLLIASGHAQIRILDRQGKQFAETVRGDQYLVDLSNTKGHTGSVNACCWHPLNKKEFMSCSDDGTLRIWSLDDFKEITRCINKQRKVIKTKNAGGKKAIPTTCAFSRDGKWLAAGCNDGSIQIWKYGSLYVNTTYLNRTAHKGPVTSVQFSANSEKILSRSLDGTMKLWNLKNFKKPELVVENLLTEYSNTDCGFSPHGELVFTGTAENVEDNTDGSLLFYDASNFELVYRINYPNLSCTKIAWHPKINQILVGLSDGSLRLYYDLTSSIRGALLCVTRPLRRARQKEVVREEMILSRM
ncbi:hypothetical protein AB6A40_007542 [Gnathostoma spinigerum]|uniref:Uncharacterized protein n=1 Tax=Gnathostoma spinigerum TaxID=75299 RepID=A0ABD6EUV8_9BILA